MDGVILIKSKNYAVFLNYKTGLITFTNYILGDELCFDYDKSILFLKILLRLLPFGYESSLIFGDMESFLETGWNEFSI